MCRSRLFFFFLVFLFFIFLSFLNTATGVITCPITCQGSVVPVVRFPFRLTGQPYICGYPGFRLSCSNNRTQTQTRTVIQFPNSSGEFTVQNIDYTTQTIIINDPDSCLPRRFLDQSLILSGSPFEEQSNSFAFTFLNCSASDQPPSIGGARYIDCLSGRNFTVVAIPTYGYNNNESVASPSSCSLISTVSIPVLWPVWSNLAEGVTLKWKEPDCTSCEERGGVCGFKNDKTLDMDIGCANLRHSPGLPRSAKYGIIIGVGIPGLLCFIGLGCYLCGKVGNYYQRRNSTTEFSTAVTPRPPAVVLTGLDGPTIESYPKTLLGDSGRLPKPNDTTCAICLYEYQPKETLRTIPECNHYFHANCIDEWLRMNAACPLCRKTPDGSALVTPSTSTSSSSSSTLSLLSVP